MNHPLSNSTMTFKDLKINLTRFNGRGGRGDGYIQDLEYRWDTSGGRRIRVRKNKNIQKISLKILILLSSSLIFIILYSIKPSQTFSSFQWFKKNPKIQTSLHPIQILLNESSFQHRKTFRRVHPTLRTLYDSYVQKNDRQPPPHFEEWFKLHTLLSSCPIPPFNHLSNSLLPFFSIPPKEIKVRTELLSNLNDMGRVRARFGKVVRFEDMTKGERGKDSSPRKAVEEMLIMAQEFGAWIPDVDFFVNALDEPKVIVPWEKLEEIKKNSFEFLNELEFKDHGREIEKYAYEILISTCSPSSPARIHHHDDLQNRHDHRPSKFYHDFSKSFPIISKSHKIDDEEVEGYRKETTENFIRDDSNWCDFPDYKNLHAFFLHPLSWSYTQELVPIFSSSKIQGFNDILIPPAWYWNDNSPYDPSDDVEWDKKISKIYWTGSGTGGRSIGFTYRGWVRQRFVSLFNSISMDSSSSTIPILLSFTKSSKSSESSESLKSLKSKESESRETILRRTFVPLNFLKGFGDVAFSSTDVHGEESSLKSQREGEESFRFSGWREFKKNFEFKMIWDGDGVAFSGRFKSLLKSSSVVVKTRLFREALDELMVPWVHYIPLSLRLLEIHNILLYFLGTRPLEPQSFIPSSLGHDEELERIAQQGSEYAEQCMGKVEMMLYTYRTVIEWARIMDDDRDTLGFRLPTTTLEDDDD